MDISVALAVRNEERNLSACLESVRDLAGEIVIVDGASADGTVGIAKSFGARVTETENRQMFHINKQMALDACRGDWILQLDADEVVPPALADEIRAVVAGKGKAADGGDLNGYSIPRRNYFWGHFMRKGGQYPDYVIRLVRRGKARFPCKSVHEQIEIDGAIGYLKEPMLHYSYRTRADYWKKADAYTSLTAREMEQHGIRPSPSAAIRYCIVRPAVTFLKLYVRHKGFVDGVVGFEFSLYSALHSAIAYRKLASAGGGPV
jgi:glycosyltransferase involved in cell wall biosynthesis